ncbi:MAG: hypothetical protein M1816_004597, partial [Peltula sp. TS41687]
LVRKELKHQGSDHSASETELLNPSILKLLCHPNIIELLGCFLYHSKLNLIFPRAQGGSLRNLFRGPRSENFRSDRSILIALSGLCSAICTVHEFVSFKHKLELIGCHHDLKPEKCTGLSRFKEGSELSETPRRVVHPVYSAPECYGVEDEVENPMVHRFSDIWSLGCIMVEVVTYMLEGAEGITAFRDQRRHKVSRITCYRFHYDGAKHPAITSWIDKLQQSGLRIQQMISQLVDGMLQIKHSDRPRAKEVEAKMQFIALDAICQDIDKLYRDTYIKADSIQPTLDLERTRFDSWSYACGMLESSEARPLRQWDDTNTFSFVCETLEQLETELKVVLDDDMDISSREGQDHARIYLEQRLSATLDMGALVGFGRDDGDSSSLAQRFSIMAAVKCMTEILRERPAPSGYIDRKRLTRKERINDFRIEYLDRDDGVDPKRQVVVESKTYQEHHGDRRTAKELQDRLESITSLLKEANHVTGRGSFRVLPYPSAYNCGLVFEFPDSSTEQSFITLRSALEMTYNKREPPPPLEQRFQLAQALLTSVMNFHTVSWLQKSISSFNVACFHATDEPLLSGIANPFFLGFLYSRVDDDNAFTEGPTDDPDHQGYQHPGYRGRERVGRNRGGVRYQVEYDYDSLGLVLLEIGVWRPLNRMLKRSNTECEQSSSDQSSTSELDCLLRYVEQLKYTMGSRYQRVVDTCLHGAFVGSSGGLDAQDDAEEKNRHVILRSFAGLVVERLAQCNR